MLESIRWPPGYTRLNVTLMESLIVSSSSSSNKIIKNSPDGTNGRTCTLWTLSFLLVSPRRMTFLEAFFRHAKFDLDRMKQHDSKRSYPTVLWLYVLLLSNSPETTKHYRLSDKSNKESTPYFIASHHSMASSSVSTPSSNTWLGLAGLIRRHHLRVWRALSVEVLVKKTSYMKEVIPVFTGALLVFWGASNETISTWAPVTSKPIFRRFSIGKIPED